MTINCRYCGTPTTFGICDDCEESRLTNLEKRDEDQDQSEPTESKMISLGTYRTGCIICAVLGFYMAWCIWN